MDLAIARPAPRRLQKRGVRRILELLEAAETIFAAKGYEPATMTEIAAEAGAAIGTLYQFFPKKELMAEKLRERYADIFVRKLDDIGVIAHWESAEDLGVALFNIFLDMSEECPAMLNLMELTSLPEPIQRSDTRGHIAAILGKNWPELPKTKARRVSTVVLQIMKAGVALKAEQRLPDRETTIHDLRKVLCSYLIDSLGQLPVSAR